MAGVLHLTSTTHAWQLPGRHTPPDCCAAPLLCCAAGPMRLPCWISKSMQRMTPCTTPHPVGASTSAAWSLSTCCAKVSTIEQLQPARPFCGLHAPLSVARPAPRLMLSLLPAAAATPGGLQAVQAANEAKAKILYQAIADSNGFYNNPVEPASRSLMNVPFTIPSAPELENVSSTMG